MFDIKIHGKSVRKYTHNGFLYIEGREGTEYSIELKNNYSTRKLFVISVDGINVISGKPAVEDPHNGYVISGYNKLNLKGFRLNDSDVAAFKFVKSSQSYAKDITGSDQNAGVIGIKIYDEAFVMRNLQDWFEPMKDYSYPPIHVKNNTAKDYEFTPSITCSTSTPINNAFYSSSVLRSYAPDQKEEFGLGTGWGSKQTQKVRDVTFEVGTLLETQIVYYASRPELEKMGIDFEDKPKIKTMPSAFGEQKFCKPPSGWRG